MKKEISILKYKVHRLETEKLKIEKLKEVEENSLKVVTVESLKYKADVKRLNKLIKFADNKVKHYESKVRNAKYMIVTFDQSDRKGWRYRSSAKASPLRNMKDLPRKWSKRKIQLVYISKNEKKMKVKKEYMEIVAETKQNKRDLESQLRAL